MKIVVIGGTGLIGSKTIPNCKAGIGEDNQERQTIDASEIGSLTHHGVRC